MLSLQRLTLVGACVSDLECVITDPDGQLIELVQAPGDPAAPPRSD